MTHIANRYVIPAAFEYQRRVAESVNATKAAGVDCVEGKKLLDELCALTCEIRRRTTALQHALDHQGGESSESHAKHFRDTVVPAMTKLRETGDRLETLIPHDLWPLPTYREMLFLK